jgi:adenylate kinase
MNTELKNIKLTDSQNDAFEKIIDFLIRDNKQLFMVLNGQPGVGKTTLMKYVINYLSNFTDKINSIVVIAPTHKAKRVIDNTINTGRTFKITCITISKLLSKCKDHSYIGTKKFTDGKTDKMDDYDIFILDEVSMVSDKELNIITDYIRRVSLIHEGSLGTLIPKKLLMIGDNCQIPSPCQKLEYIKINYDLEDSRELRSEELYNKNIYCIKPDSKAFDFDNIITLNEIVRQQKDSIIIKIASNLRYNIDQEFILKDLITDIGLYDKVYINYNELYDITVCNSIINDIKNGIDSRIITYTNIMVKTHNLAIRKQLGYNELLVKNEILTGYNNIGFPQPYIENGCDYKVEQVSINKNKVILKYKNLVGYDVKLINMDKVCENNSKHLFFISAYNTENYEFIKYIIELAEIVNSKNSTIKDFKKYIKVKETCVFLEDVYKYMDNIYNESDFKSYHPLLFSKVIDVIDEKKLLPLKNDLAKNIYENYKDVIEYRLEDTKEITENETFADIYKVIEKDMYYGYALTAHKSQGSTYKNVYVDENDFYKIKDRWNHNMNCVEIRTRERNQLLYVSITRPSDKLYIFY